VAYWTASAARRGRWIPLFWAAFYLALAMNARITCIAMAPVLGLAALLAGQRADPLHAVHEGKTLGRRIAALVTGGLAGAVLSGLAITVVHNFAIYHRPFGSPAMGKVVQPDFSLTQAWTHTVRAVLFLIEFPEQPVESVRTRLADTGNALIPAVGAATILPGEEHPLWPGRFKFEVRPIANKYSLGGILWMAGIAGAGAVAGRRILRTRPRIRLPAVVWLMGLSAAALLEQIYFLRWAGGTWPRYWIGCYAVGAAAAVVLLARSIRLRPWPGALALLALVWMTYPSLRASIGWVESAAQTIRPAAALDEPYEAVTPLLEPGSRTLLLCVRATRDYGLFLPRQGYAAEVYPWGKRQPDTDRLERMIRDHRITHVLFERDDVLGFHWDPVVRTGEMVRWMQARPDFHEVLLPDPRMRLFERGDGPRTHAVPAFYGFDSAMGLGDLEHFRVDEEEQSVRWGVGPGTTLGFKSQGGRARLLLECRRNNSPDQAITIKVNGQEVAARALSDPRFTGIEAEFESAPGENTITIEYRRQETDRNLAVLYRRLQVLAVRPH
jgi:hypothetical protein